MSRSKTAKTKTFKEAEWIEYLDHASHPDYNWRDIDDIPPSAYTSCWGQVVKEDARELTIVNHCQPPSEGYVQQACGHFTILKSCILFRAKFARPRQKKGEARQTKPPSAQDSLRS